MKTEKQGRTWWLMFDTAYGDTFDIKKVNKDDIEVISYEDHLAIIQKYEDRITKLREALTFYANEVAYEIADTMLAEREKEKSNG